MRTLALVALVALVVIVATSIASMRLMAQDSTGAPPKLCFRGRPAPACRQFVLTEIGIYRIATVSRSTLRIPYVDGNGETVTNSYSQDDMGGQLTWEVGMMANRGRRTALGGTIILGVGDGGADVGLKGRYRRWLAPNGMALDVGAGIVSGTVVPAYNSARAGGVTGDLALNAGDYGAVVVRGDVLRVNGRSARAIYGGVRLGSKPALAGTAVVAAGFLALLAIFAGGID